MSHYYRDEYGRWNRRLLVLEGLNGKRFIDISLTSDSEHGWSIVKEERLRHHRTANGLIVLVDRVPGPVEIEMGLFLSAALTERLLEFNYIKELRLSNILRGDQENPETHGLPASRVPKTPLRFGGVMVNQWGV